MGPIARSARDLVPLLRIMAGPDGIDPNARDVRLRSAEDVRWTGRRATVAPVGFDHRGLPLAVQVVSRPGNDHLTIAGALLIEARYGGRIPPA